MERVRGAWRWYEAVLRARPLATNITTTFALWTAGDVLAHSIDRKDPALSSALLTGTYAGAVIGSSGHYWYHNLDRFAARIATPATAGFYGAKIGLDVLLFDPLHIGLFMAGMTAIERRSWSAVQDKLKADFLCTYAVDAAFWSVFQVFNFKLVPRRHQMLFVNIGCIAESVFLCWTKSHDNWTEMIFPVSRRSSQEAVSADIPQSLALDQE